MDPVSTGAAGATSIIKILEFSYQLKGVNEQTTDLLRTTEHVNRNVAEARRLRRQKGAQVSTDVKAWMDEQIKDSEDALRDVQHLVEPARINTETSHTINPKNRLLWVLRDNPKVKDKRDRLQFCNQTLNNVIGVLHATDVVVVAPLPTESRGEAPPPYSNGDMEALFSWRSQRRGRKSSLDPKDRDISPSAMSSMSTPVDPARVLRTPDTAFSSPSEGQLSPPTSLSSSSVYGMTSKTAPSSYFPSYDAFDGLQVVESVNHSHVTDSTWSTTMLSQRATELPVQTNSASTTGPLFPPQNSSWQPVTQEQKHVTSDWLDSGMRNPASSPQLPGSWRGREWLACYATRSDMRTSQEQLQSHNFQ